MNVAVRGGKPHIFSVTLRRQSANVPWGIRIVGGSDTGSCFIITRVSAPPVGGYTQLRAACLPSGNIPDFVLEAPRFESRPRHRLSVFCPSDDSFLPSPFEFIGQSLFIPAADIVAK
jgi:hypothetical protein